MKVDIKKLIVLVIAIILVIGIIIFIKNKDNIIKPEGPNTEVLVQKLEDGTKVNTSSKLNEVKKVENIEITNSQLTNKNGKTTLLADVKNVGNEKIDILELEVTFIDSNNNEIKTVNGMLGTIKPGQTVQLNLETTSDYTNIYDYLVKIK